MLVYLETRRGKGFHSGWVIIIKNEQGLYLQTNLTTWEEDNHTNTKEFTLPEAQKFASDNGWQIVEKST